MTTIGEIIENKIVGFYKVISAHLESIDYWGLSDGQKHFRVTIKDDDFISKVINDKLIFYFRDIIKCQILMKQIIMNGLVKTEYIVTKVLEYPQHQH